MLVNAPEGEVGIRQEKNNRSQLIDQVKGARAKEWEEC